MMDKLSFKRITCKTDPDKVGSDNEYILAEVIINDRPFLDYLTGEHEYNYNLAVSLYNELIGVPNDYDPEFPGENKAVILACSACFHERCNPLAFTFEETDTEIIWSGWYNYPTKTTYSEIPVLCFEKEQYKTALAQLKEIADEGPRVGMTE